MNKLTTKECKKRGLANNFKLLSSFNGHKNKLKWKCLSCGHVFYRLINNIRKERKCPNCTPKYTPKERVCSVCKKIYKTIHSNTSTCSLSCRNKKNYKYQPKPILIKICIKCSQKFKTSNPLKIYCSVGCRKSDRYRKESKGINYKIRKNIRDRIKDLIKGRKKNFNSIVELVGCSINDLRGHIEKLFQPGMTWDNYGYWGWHIDHIIPLSSFNLSKKGDLFKSCHYTNLQPLWREDNLKKGDKINEK